MTHSEQIIEIDRLHLEVTRKHLAAIESKARHKLRSGQINTVLEMLKVWSDFNLAAMWGYRDPDEKGHTQNE